MHAWCRCPDSMCTFVQQIVSVCGLQWRDKMDRHKLNWNASICLFPVDFQESLIDKFTWEAFEPVLTCYYSLTCLRASRNGLLFRHEFFSTHQHHLPPFDGDVFRSQSQFHFPLLFLMCRLQCNNFMEYCKRSQRTAIFLRFQHNPETVTREFLFGLIRTVDLLLLREFTRWWQWKEQPSKKNKSNLQVKFPSRQKLLHLFQTTMICEDGPKWI